MNNTEESPESSSNLSSSTVASTTAYGNNNAIDKRRKKVEEVRRIFATDEYTSMSSPTKRAIHFYQHMVERGYPNIPKTVLFQEFGVKKKRYYAKERKVKNGFPYELETKCPILNEKEGDELIAFIRMNAERRSCVTLDEVVDKATELVRMRKIEVNFGERLNKDSVKGWCLDHGICFSRGLTDYQAMALSNREAIQKMYDNLRLLMERYGYRPEMILNMDETWAATEKKVSTAFVAHPPDLPPIAHAPADGAHITLIGCISKGGEVVLPTYILPSPLKTGRLREQFHLEKLPYFVNKSGFMTGGIFAAWIEGVLAPWIARRRQNPFEHALLICDAHTSRMNESAKAALKRNLIDMIVLPAHVTSKHQPLDVGVYSSYKNKFRELAKKVPGGVYGRVWASVNAFHAATMPMNIYNAWDKSKLFSSDYKSVIESYLPRAADVMENDKSNYVVESTPIAEV